MARWPSCSSPETVTLFSVPKGRSNRLRLRLELLRLRRRLEALRVFGFRALGDFDLALPRFRRRPSQVRDATCGSAVNGGRGL